MPNSLKDLRRVCDMLVLHTELSQPSHGPINQRLSDFQAQINDLDHEFAILIKKGVDIPDQHLDSPDKLVVRHRRIAEATDLAQVVCPASTCNKPS